VFDHHKEHFVEEHLTKMEQADEQIRRSKKYLSISYVFSSGPTLSMPLLHITNAISNLAEDEPDQN